MAVEKYANAFWTHLTAPMLVGDLTAHVALAAPGTLQGGQFRIAIGTELLLVTAGGATTTWTVSRGVEGTTAVTHATGATVAHVLTVAGLFGATGVFDVRAFGADPSYSAAVNRAAIQATIDAAGSPVAVEYDLAEQPADSIYTLGGTVTFGPRGVYLIDGPLYVPSFVRLTGANRPLDSVEQKSNPLYLWSQAETSGVTIKAGGALNFPMIVDASTSSGRTGVEIDHLRFDQRGVTGNNDIFYLEGVWRWSIHDNVFLGSPDTTHLVGINIVESEEIRIYDNRFDTCGVSGLSTNAMVVSHNDIGARQNDGVFSQGGYGGRFEGNHIYNSLDNGIRSTNDVGLTITGNHIEDCEHRGIYVDGLSLGIISSNVVKQCSKEVANTWAGIVLESSAALHPSENNIVIGNQCTDPAVSPTQKYGIDLVSYSGSQTNGNVIMGNRVSGNVSGGAHQQAGLTNIIRDNTGWVTEAKGTGTIASGTTSVVVTHGLSVTPAAGDIMITLSGIPPNDTGNISVGGQSWNRFTVYCRNDPGGSGLNFSWQARVL